MNGAGGAGQRLIGYLNPYVEYGHLKTIWHAQFLYEGIIYLHKQFPVVNFTNVLCKGQLISEWLSNVLNFPKN